MNQATNQLFRIISSEVVDAVLEAAMPYAANSTIGFLKLELKGSDRTNANPVGSGTLTHVGEVYGVVTAAHVRKALLAEHEFGVIRFVSRSRIQKIMTRASEADWVAVGVENVSKDGPDIAFLRLAPDVTGWLKALGCNFINISKSKDERLQGRRDGLEFIRAISGVIAERTHRRASGNELVVSVEASFTPGKPTTNRTHEGFDFIDIEVANDGVPASYGGTSGGGVWRIPIRSSDNTIAAPPSLDGVAFFESGNTSPRLLTCHGPDSIHVRLHQLIKDKWPQSVS